MTIAADLGIVGFFFAMCLCESTATPKLRRTKTIDMYGITFLDNNKHEIPQDHLGLALAIYVTYLFADQNKGDKNARQITVIPWQGPYINGSHHILNATH